VEDAGDAAVTGLAREQQVRRRQGHEDREKGGGRKSRR